MNNKDTDHGAPAAPNERGVMGFSREDLEAVVDSLDSGYERTVNVGNTTGEGDEHIESTTAYAARFIRAALAGAPEPSSDSVAKAARTLADFADTAPGRLPQRVHDAITVARAAHPDPSNSVGHYEAVARAADAASDIPDYLWLQVDIESPDIDDCTWCRDKINDSDVRYVRADRAALAGEAAGGMPEQPKSEQPDSFHLSAPGGQPMQAQGSGEPPTLFQVTLEPEEAETLRDAIGGDDEAQEMVLSVGPGHSGYGLYAWAAEYPEEGAVLVTSLDAALAKGENTATARPDGCKDAEGMAVSSQANQTEPDRAALTTSAPLPSPPLKEWVEKGMELAARWGDERVRSAYYAADPDAARAALRSHLENPPTNPASAPLPDALKTVQALEDALGRVMHGTHRSSDGRIGRFDVPSWATLEEAADALIAGRALIEQMTARQDGNTGETE